MKSEPVKFETNKPEEVSLAYDDGKPINGQYGPTVMYKLSDNRVMFVPPEVREKIQAAGITRNQPFLICKSETVNGSRTVEWKIGRTREQQQQTEANQPQPVTRLQRALIAAVDAAYSAQQHAKEIGFTAMPQFTGEDLRTMTNTLLIQNGGSR